MGIAAQAKEIQGKIRFLSFTRVRRRNPLKCPGKTGSYDGYGQDLVINLRLNFPANVALKDRGA
jgi:hypothetical protein